MHHRHATRNTAVSRTARYITSTQHSDSEWIPASARGEPPPITPPRRSNTEHARGDGLHCAAGSQRRTLPAALRAALQRRPERRQLWSGALTMFYTGTRPVMVFTAGAPGAGKTYTGIDSLASKTSRCSMLLICSTDSAMKRHPEYSEETS